MRAQTWRLLQVTELSNVSLKIIPLTVGPHRASATGGFTLLDFAEQNGGTPPSTVYSESLTGAQFVIRNPNARTTCGCGSSFTV